MEMNWKHWKHNENTYVWNGNGLAQLETFVKIPMLSHIAVTNFSLVAGVAASLP